MNGNDPAHSLRGPLHQSSAGLNSRSAPDNRNGLSSAINAVSTTGVSRTAETVMSPGTLMSRAEKFEDEKRRIIESCFGKKETDGSSTLRPAWVESRHRLMSGRVQLEQANVSFGISLRIVHHPYTDPGRCCTSIKPSTPTVTVGK